MTALHASIVARFRAGENVAQIGLSIGYSRQHVYRILRNKAGVTLRRTCPRGARIPRYRNMFQSRPDGEYCLCRHCEKLGYGMDSWHPATSEFWKVRDGQLHLSQCLACISDVQAGRRGVVPERMAI